MAAGALSGVVLDLEPFELLASVIELGSLSAAAARHGVSQPALSARMRTLERRIGFPLLVRSPNGSRATAEGILVARAAGAVLREAEALAHAIDVVRAVERGSVRLAASLTIAEHLLPRWLDTLQAMQPSISVELRVENSERVVELVASGQADLGFIETAGPPNGLAASTVATDELLVVCAPSHPWGNGSTISPSDLAATRLVVRELGAGGRHLLEERLAELGLAMVAPTAEVASPAALAAAVAAGIAPGVVSRWAVSADILTGRLHQVTVEGLDLQRDLRAVWRPGEPPPVLRTLTSP